jgi:hypothetical protein
MIMFCVSITFFSLSSSLCIRLISFQSVLSLF